MPSPHRMGSRRRSRSARRVLPASSLLVVAMSLALSPAVQVSAHADPADPGAASEPGATALSPGADSRARRSDITMVQANLPMRLASGELHADLRTVLAERPDFVTYNEVAGRDDSLLAPGTYAIHRNRTNKYTAETAVAWRTDTWRRVDSGTRRVSNVRRVPPGWDGMIGLRYANWVTLKSRDGRRVSVVSAHLAPLARRMPDLVRPSVTHLAALVRDLAPRGPVLVGGDFNVHYTSQRYPRDLFRAARMVPTYDTLKRYFPTGDHEGATIDYLFNRGAGLLRADAQSRSELHSDHDAVRGGFSWTKDAPSQTTVLVSDPRTAGGPRRRAVVGLVDAVRKLGAGSTLDVVTGTLSIRRLYLTVRNAVERGVTVHLTTRSEVLTAREERLAHMMSQRAGASSVRRCREACVSSGRRAGVPRTLVVVRNPSGAPVLRMDLNRKLDAAMLQRRTRLVARTGDLGLAEGVRLMAALR